MISLTELLFTHMYDLITRIQEEWIPSYNMIDVSGQSDFEVLSACLG